MGYSNSKTFNTNICIDLPELEVGVCVDVECAIWGRHYPQTRYSPEEWPEMEITGWSGLEIDDDYRENTDNDVDEAVVAMAVDEWLNDNADAAYEKVADASDVY